jgi:hypothetical protein
MGQASHATVRITGNSDDDGEEIAQLTRQLRTAILSLDVENVEPVAGEAPNGAKGVTAVLGWLSVTLGGELLKSVADRVADWAMSRGRSVEITVDGDTLKLGGVTRARQEELTREWLARHPISSPAGGSQERGYL